MINENDDNNLDIFFSPEKDDGNIEYKLKLINLTKIRMEQYYQLKKKDKTDDKNILRSGDKATIKFRFKYKPVFIKEGYRIIFRENKIRGIGIIKNVEYSTPFNYDL